MPLETAQDFGFLFSMDRVGSGATGTKTALDHQQYPLFDLTMGEVKEPRQCALGSAAQTSGQGLGRGLRDQTGIDGNLRGRATL